MQELSDWLSRIRAHKAKLTAGIYYARVDTVKVVDTSKLVVVSRTQSRKQ